MHFKLATLALLLAALSLSPGDTFSQVRQSNVGYLTVSAQGGAFIFLGDVKRYLVFPAPDEIRSGASVHLGYKVSPRTNLRLRAVSGGMAGYRGTESFEGNYDELSLLAELQLSRLLPLSQAFHQRLVVYALAGAGVGRFDSEYKDLCPSGSIFTEEASGTTAVVPLGMGVSYRLTPRISLVLEMTNSVTFRDDLDTVVRNRNDVVNMTLLGLEFRFWDTRTPTYGCPF